MSVPNNSTPSGGSGASQAIVDGLLAETRALERKHAANLEELRGTLLAMIPKMRNHLNMMEGFLLGDRFPHPPHHMPANYFITPQGVPAFPVPPNFALHVPCRPQLHPHVAGQGENTPPVTKLQSKLRKVKLVKRLPDCPQFRQICEHRRLLQRQQCIKKKAQLRQAKETSPPPPPAGNQHVQLCEFHAEEAKAKNQKTGSSDKNA